MKKDLVIKNLECGNGVKDITLSISPITFLVGPDFERVNDIVCSASIKFDEELDVEDYHLFKKDAAEFFDIWTEKLGVDDSFRFTELRRVIDRSTTGSFVTIVFPENSLYPNKQSLLADMFYDAYKRFGTNFVIYTNSEYLIRKSQLLVATEVYEQPSEEEVGDDCPFATYYVPDKADGKAPYSLRYRKDGIFINAFGKGFYDVAAKLALKI